MVGTPLQTLLPYMENCLSKQVTKFNVVPLINNCINAYARGKTTDLGKYNALARVLYITLAQVLKFLLVLYNALARALELSL